MKQRFLKSDNKVLLQRFAKKNLADLAKLTNVYLILGGIVIDDGCQNIETSAYSAHPADKRYHSLQVTLTRLT